MSSALESPWPSDLVRLFMSHSALYKVFASGVAERLAKVGVHGFVAHHSMKITKPWQEQIENALATAEAFVVLGHPEVTTSPWCQQEIGWAYGRQIPFFYVRIGADPAGFPGRLQWPSASADDAEGVAQHISVWLNQQQALRGRITTGLVTALTTARNYYEARDAAVPLSEIGGLTEEQWAAVDQALRSNKQVGTSIWATRALEPLYRASGRAMPSYGE